jgi:hypothetical protein
MLLLVITYMCWNTVSYIYIYVCVCVFRNKATFYGEELLASHPIPKLEDHPSSDARGCLFNVLAAGCHPSFRNPKMCHAVVTRDPPNMVPMALG